MTPLPPVWEKLAASRTTNVVGMNIHYYDWGPREAPIVLVYVHGWAATGIEALPLAEDITRQHHTFRIIAVDLPGCGFSDRPSVSLGMEGYSTFLAQWLVVVQNELEVAIDARIVLWAHSMGGHIALNTLWNYRFGWPVDQHQQTDASVLRAALARVERVVLCAPAGLKGEEGLLLLFRNRLLMKIVAGLATRPLYNLAAKLRVYKDISRCPPLVLDVEWEGLHYQQGMKAMIDITADTLASGALNEKLHAFALPVLLIWGKDDCTLPFRYAQTFAADLPNVQFHSFEDCGHIPHIEKIQEVSTLIRNFV